MEWEIITPDRQPVTRWSGGETRELYIAPEGSSYQQRDFSLRLSSASVAVPRSEFTDLPGYRRWLTPLQGRVRLQHDDGPAVELQPLETDAFDGGSRTLSWGMCRDFNVMLSKESKARVRVEGWQSSRQKLELPGTDGQHHYFYVPDGEAWLKTAGLTISLPKGSLLHLHSAAAPLQLQYRGMLLHVVLD